MTDVGLWDGIGRSLMGGKFQLRLVLQPTAAVLLGIRFGLVDAKQNKEPYLLGVFHAARHDRWPALKQGLRDAIVPLCLAFVLDSIVQRLLLGRVRPLAALMVGALLAFLPFVLARGAANRIWTHGHPRQFRQSA
jgi:hypothetical protein